MSHWDRLPEELETRIWKTYFQIHVLPHIRRPLERHLRRLVRRLQGTSIPCSDSVLPLWTELIACHWKTLEEARVHLEHAFPESTVLKRYDDDTTKLFWTYTCHASNEHLFSVMKEPDRYYLSYHGSSTYETVVVDVQSYEMRVHSRMVSTRTPCPEIRSWNRRRMERISPDSTLGWT